MQAGQYELSINIHIRDLRGSGSIGFQQDMSINAASFDDVANIMKRLHELMETIKEQQPKAISGPARGR